MRLGKHLEDFQVIKDYHDKKPDIPIQTLCQLLKVSRSGYYKWHNHIETVSETENKKLMKKIKEFHRNYNGILGYRRMTNFINRQLGTNYNKKRIRRLMKILGIRSVIRRVRQSCTKGGRRFYEDNILNRDFTTTAPNQKWCTDVTYLQYALSAKAYLSVIKDLYDGSIIAYEIGHKNDNPLVIKTIKKALELKSGATPIIHSDRGSQYTSKECRYITQQAGLTFRLAHYLQATYGDIYDHPFEKYPEFSSYRYPLNHKWYALIMTVARGKLDLGDETWSKEALEQKIEIINIKVNPKDLPQLLEIRGIYPSYHMSKKSWVSLVLDETVSDDLLFSLVENSRALVAGKSLGSLSGPDYWIIPANLKYYDIDAEFAANSIINWTQKASIKVGDYVVIYITAPTCALRYLCRVLESDIPNSGYREEKSIKKLMKIELLQTFSDSQFPIAVLKKCGVTNIRGPRRMTKELITLIDSNIKS